MNEEQNTQQKIENTLKGATNKGDIMSYVHVLRMTRNPRERVQLAQAKAESRKHTAKIVQGVYRLVKSVGLLSAIYMSITHMPMIKAFAVKLMWRGALQTWGF